MTFNQNETHGLKPLRLETNACSVHIVLCSLQGTASRVCGFPSNGLWLAFLVH